MKIPNDLQAEEVLLGRMITSINAANSAFEVLKPMDFYEPKNAAIFEAMLILYKSDMAIEPLSVSSVLQEKHPNLNDISYLFGLTQYNITSADSTSVFIKKIKDLSVKRSVLNLCLKISECSKSNTYDKEMLLDEALSGFDNILKETDEFKLQTPKDILNGNFLDSGMSFRKYLEKKRDLEHANIKTLEGIPTHLFNLDEALDGLNKKHFIVIAARPGMGKTTFIIQIMVNLLMKSQARIGFFSLEMTSDEAIMKMTSNISSIPWERAKKGLLTHEEFERYCKAGESLSEYPLFIDDQTPLTIGQVSSRARRMKMSHNIDILFIDYLGEVKGGDKFFNRQEEIQHVSKGLRAIAKNLNIPVVCVCQLNREVEKDNRKPKKSDLRESGQIEADAHSILILHRPNDQNPLNVDVHIVKNRFGVEKKISFFADLAKSTFTEFDWKSQSQYCEDETNSVVI